MIKEIPDAKLDDGTILCRHTVETPVETPTA